MKNINWVLNHWHKSDSKYSLILRGMPGIGKTAIVNQFCKANNIELVECDLNNMDELDLRGKVVERSDENGEYMDFLIPKQFLLANKMADSGKQVCIFFDEVSRASEDVQRALFKIIQPNHVCGEVEFNKNIKFILATNMGEDDGTIINSYLMDDKAGKRRFICYDVELDLPSWVSWAKSSGAIHPMVLSFVEASKSIYAPADNSNENDTYPSSFEKISELLKVNGEWLLDTKDILQVLNMFGDSCMKSSTRIELEDFINTSDSLLLDKIISGDRVFGTRDECINVIYELQKISDKGFFVKNSIDRFVSFFENSKEHDLLIRFFRVLKENFKKVFKDYLESLPEETCDKYLDWLVSSDQKVS